MAAVTSQLEQKLRARATRRVDVLAAILHELEQAYAKHGDEPWGRHEAYAITLEELDEAWDAIRADAPGADVRHELAQTAAMCIRYLEQEGDRYRGIDQ